MPRAVVLQTQSPSPARDQAVSKQNRRTIPSRQRPARTQRPVGPSQTPVSTEAAAASPVLVDPTIEPVITTPAKAKPLTETEFENLFSLIETVQPDVPLSPLSGRGFLPAAPTTGSGLVMGIGLHAPAAGPAAAGSFGIATGPTSSAHGAAPLISGGTSSGGTFTYAGDTVAFPVLENSQPSNVPNQPQGASWVDLHQALAVQQSKDEILYLIFTLLLRHQEQMRKLAEEARRREEEEARLLEKRLQERKAEQKQYKKNLQERKLAQALLERRITEIRELERALSEKYGKILQLTRVATALATNLTGIAHKLQLSQITQIQPTDRAAVQESFRDTLSPEAKKLLGLLAQTKAELTSALLAQIDAEHERPRAFLLSRVFLSN